MKRRCEILNYPNVTIRTDLSIAKHKRRIRTRNTNDKYAHATQRVMGCCYSLAAVTESESCELRQTLLPVQGTPVDVAVGLPSTATTTSSTLTPIRVQELPVPSLRVEFLLLDIDCNMKVRCLPERSRLLMSLLDDAANWSEMSDPVCAGFLARVPPGQCSQTASNRVALASIIRANIMDFSCHAEGARHLGELRKKTSMWSETDTGGI